VVTNMASLLQDEVFIVLFAVMFLAVVATLPIDNPVTDLAHDLVGSAFFAIIGVLAVIGAASGILVGLLALGVIGWIAIVLGAFLLFRQRIGSELVLVSLFFFALMLLL